MTRIELHGPGIDEPLPKGICHCKFGSRLEQREKIADLLRRDGDGIPEEFIKSASKELDKWDTVCDCDTNEILSEIRRDRTDWYQVTMKNLVTRKEWRGKKLGQIVTNMGVMRAIREEPGIAVLNADITWNNYGSKKIFENIGFEEMGRFCWAKGEEPADIVHYILYPPDAQNKCSKP